VTVDQRRVPQQQRSKQCVEAILAAARSLLQTDEPAHISTRDVAARAGVSPAVVYRYFADIDEIVDALLAEHAAIAESMVAEALARSEHQSIGDVFEFVIRSYLDLYSRRRDLTVAWRSPALAERQRHIEEPSDRSLALAVGDHLVTRGLLTELDPRHIALLCAHWTTAGALIGLILRSDEAAKPQLVDELIALAHFFASRY
jgi:AcrR family transcriptional regulator